MHEGEQKRGRKYGRETEKFDAVNFYAPSHHKGLQTMNCSECGHVGKSMLNPPLFPFWEMLLTGIIRKA